MAYRIIYHPQAEAELDRLYDDIAEAAGSSVAGAFVGGLIDLIEGLETFPERGTERESPVTGLRIIGYRRSASVAFTVRGNDVFILGVFARGRDITDDILAARET